MLVQSTVALSRFDFSDIGRLAAAVVAAGLGALYVAACIYLGRDKLYGGRGGLVTTGPYAWSRNPQYALAIPAYVALGLAAMTPQAVILALMLAGTFVLMAALEEPWLLRTYGQSYERYRLDVARFYNVKRLRRRLMT
jgi:protein-S-isoprenylcysteine O-methyltransferase Ste14